MIFGIALANITHKLDTLRQSDGQGISSHVKLKEEGLACLKALIEEAPTLEYLKFLDAKDHGLLLAYTLNLLCHCSKNDKSKSIRTTSLETMMSLMNRLERLHEKAPNCSISSIVSALPGVSSTLFQLIMSDTKLPRKLLITAIRNLSKLLSITFLPCTHKSLTEEQGKQICDNLAIRLKFLIEYSTCNSAELPNEILVEVLDLCNTIISQSNDELLSKSITPIVKYLAFISANNAKSEVKLKLMIVTDILKEKVQNCEEFDTVIITGITSLLDNLETALLAKEREAELAILLGYLKLLSEDPLTTFLEIEHRRRQLIDMLIRLSEFSTNQPFFLLTDSKVNEDAIEISGSRMYSVEKRFKHVTGDEISLIQEICFIIGSSTEWPSLVDIISNDLRKFSDPSNLHITRLILQGMLRRKQVSARFTASMLVHYVDSTQEEFIRADEENALTIVIAIESIATLVEIHLQFAADQSVRVIILKDLLCPMLKWASSESRAISEASLSALRQISQLYDFDSTKSLIEDNIDYIVDGVMHMLESFSSNCDVVHVLAITFKLSSKNSFYYFNDVFEKLFRVLAIYQHTEKAQLIMLLFYRVLATLIDWRHAEKHSPIGGSPLEDRATLIAILHELDIERRISGLSCEKKYPIEESKDGQQDEEEEPEEENKEPDKVPTEISLTERILQHSVAMISSDYPEVKILALKTAALGFEILCDNEDTLLPLVHKLWGPLEKRLVGNYGQNLEVSLCAFECLVSMAENAKDFIKRRTLDSIIPRVCLFLESQARESLEEKDYGPYAMTVAYKCQLKILTHLGALAYHIELAYSNLWRVVRTTLLYLNTSQMKSLRDAAKISLHYMMALDADCVWYFSKRSNVLADLPFHLVFE